MATFGTVRGVENAREVVWIGECWFRLCASCRVWLSIDDIVFLGHIYRASGSLFKDVMTGIRVSYIFHTVNLTAFPRMYIG